MINRTPSWRWYRQCSSCELAGSLLIVLSLVFPGRLCAEQVLSVTTARHVYARAANEFIRQHFTNLLAAKRIPEFGPLYLKPGEHRFVTQEQIDGAFSGPVHFAEGIMIDGKDIVALLYVLPIIEVEPGRFGAMSFATLVGGERPGEGEAFVQNGIFTSSVDLESTNCTIVGPGQLPKERGYIPRGTYLWHIGKKGAWLTGGKLSWEGLGIPKYDTNSQYMILWERPLEELPTGTFISVLRMRPVDKAYDGFEIGGPESITIMPIGSDTGEVRPKPLVRLRRR